MVGFQMDDDHTPQWNIGRWSDFSFEERYLVQQKQHILIAIYDIRSERMVENHLTTTMTCTASILSSTWFCEV